MPAAFAGRGGQAQEAAAGLEEEGQAKKPRLKADQLRELGLRPNWERAKDFPAMEEDLPRVGLAAIVRREMKRRGLHWYHTAVSIGSRRGYPDLTIWGPGGVIFRELKGTTGELTVAQYEVIVSMRECQLDTKLWWPEDYYLGVIGDELDRLAGVDEVAHQAAHRPVLRPGYRRCGCHMDADHTCNTWGRYAAILPRS